MENDEPPKDCNLSLPPWICQQYIRRPPEEHIEFLAQKQKEAAERDKTDYFDDDGRKISKKVLKRLKRAAKKQTANGLRQKQTAARGFELCNAVKCANPTVNDFNLSRLYLEQCDVTNNEICLSNRLVLFPSSASFYI